MINKSGRPIKPPPPPEGQKPYFTNEQIDSIMSRSQNIALYPIFEQVKRKFSRKESYGYEFIELVNAINKINEEKAINLSKINTSIPCKLSIVDTLQLKSDKRYIDKNYDILIRFSNISFNENQDKAVLIIGSTRGYLNGSASLVFLEKINDVWQIKGVDTFSIS